MSLARAWTRQFVGASAGALLAPAGLLIALAVLALGGGLGGLSALGQLVSGPAATPAPQAGGGARQGAANRASTALLLASLQAGAAARIGATTGAATVLTPGRTTHPGHRPPPPGGPGHPRQPPPRRGTPSAPPRNPTPPPQHQSVVDQVATTASSLTAPLPDPVGGAARQAISTVAATVDRILPPTPTAGVSVPRTPTVSVPAATASSLSGGR